MHKMESELATNATCTDQLGVISDRNEDYFHMLASFVEYIDQETTAIESGKVSFLVFNLNFVCVFVELISYFIYGEFVC